MTKNTYGTGSFVLMNVGETCPDPTEGLLTTVAWEVPAAMLGRTGGGTVTHYALEGAIFVTGAAVQWLRDGLGIIDDAAEVGPLAESVDGHRGRGGRARLHRPGRSVLGPLRPRHRAGHHPRRRAGPTWPGPWWSPWCSRPATWWTP